MYLNRRDEIRFILDQFSELSLEEILEISIQNGFRGMCSRPNVQNLLNRMVREDSLAHKIINGVKVYHVRKTNESR